MEGLGLVKGGEREGGREGERKEGREMGEGRSLVP